MKSDKDTEKNTPKPQKKREILPGIVLPGSTKAQRQNNIEFYKTIIANASDGIFICHDVPEFPHVRFILWNNRMVEITGYTADEMNASGWSQTIYRNQDVRILAKERIDRMRKGDNLEQEEWEITRKDGERRQLLISTRIIYDDKTGVNVLAMLIDITKRKQAEEMLMEIGERQRSIIEGVSYAIFTLLPTGMIDFLNPAFEKITGWSCAEWIGKPFADLLHQDDLQKGIDNFQCALRGEIPPVYELRVCFKSGNYGVGEFVLAPLFHRGMLRGVAGIVHNITERKKAEEDLKENDKRHQKYSALLSELISQGKFLSGELRENLRRITEISARLMDTERVGIWIYNKDYSQIRCEDMFELSKGAHREGEVLQSSEFPNYTSSHQLGKVIAAEDVFADPRTSKIPSFYYNAYGIKSLLDAPIWAQGRLFALLSFEHVGETRKWRAEEEQLAQTIVNYISLCYETYERKLAENSLKSSEEKYRTLVESTSDSILLLDSDRRIVSCNQGFCNLFGYKKDEVEGKSVGIVHSSEEKFRSFKELAYPVIKRNGSFRGEWNLVRKDGAEITVEKVVSEIKSPDGSTLGYVKAIRDISERKKTEKEVASLQEQVRQSQKMEGIGMLAGGIAHDFNNILTVINGMCQLSLLDLREGDPLKANLKEIEKAAQRAADLTRQLLAFSRKQVLEPQVLDLNDVIKNIDKMLHRLTGEDIELVFLLAEDIGRVKTDPGQMEQVIINLSVNARDAMPKGGKLTIKTENVELDEEYVKRHIEIKPGRYVMLSVSDTGTGMTPEIQERMFEPFFTTKEAGKGTGLGLSTVYGIVKQSGGDIWAYSEPGSGTIFKLYLPRVEEPLEEIKKKASGKIFYGNETILVVEDEDVVRKLAVRLLKKQGYNVLEAPDGGKAFMLCEKFQERIHLILTDVVMPGINGRQLVERLQKIHPESKALYMSGYTDNMISHYGVLDKEIEFLQKPFTLEGLTKKVRDALDK